MKRCEKFDLMSLTRCLTEGILQYRPMKAMGTATSPVTRLFVYPLVQAKIKETLKHRLTGPSWWESTVDQWIPLAKGQ